MKHLMNWQQLMSTTRFRPDEQGQWQALSPKNHVPEEMFRHAFHVDYDRLVFSNAFRRLGRKTQVHPFAKNDHTHNRLTHSVEVSSVGRSLGNTVGGMLKMAQVLPENIDGNDFGLVVQVACLAHDLGNPPFGHTGEDALRLWFRQPQHAEFCRPLSDAERNDVQTYEGNAHSLRQVASLEMYRQRGGMRLTAASIGALIKYPWTSSHENGRHKFNIYQTELAYFQHVAQALGLPENGQHAWARHPLSYLMEAADDICYALMDLEDAIDLELLDYREVESVMAQLINPEITWQNYHIHERIAMMRGMAIGRAIEDVAQTFVRHQTDLLNGEFRGKDLLDLCSENVRSTLLEAKKLAKDRIFRHKTKLVHELAAFPCLSSILDLLVPAAYAFLVSGSLNVQQSLALDLLTHPIKREDSLYQAYMNILDYIGGMTDNYAAQTARELSGIGMQ